MKMKNIAYAIAALGMTAFAAGSAMAGGATSKFGNRQALKDCRRYLIHGRRLFMFPEGSSSLGPRLQGIKPGAAKIVLSQ